MNLCQTFYSGFLPIQSLPFLLVLANFLLTPIESRIQRRFWREAHDKLTRLKPTVIGITGSYGKTSVKHILGHILETAGQTLITPGSVNTPMGISRIIREKLGPHHRMFVAEMGAYGPGSIKRLCDLAPPDLAVITAVGKAHYERFKTLDAVARTKFELAEATVAKGGKVIVAGDVLAFADARSFAERHPEAMIVAGEGPNAALVIRAIAQNRQGTEASITWQGQDYTLQAPLFGTHHGRNMALAFAAACTLGLSPDDVCMALKSTPANHPPA